jgi:hypothetical protein
MKNFLQNLSYLSKWKGKFKRVPWFCARHAFSVILILILLSIFLGGVLFYRYVILASAEEPNISENSLKLREDLYQKILEQWQPEEKKIQQPSQENLPEEP